MIPQTSLLVMLVCLVDRIPTPPPPTKPGRGRPFFYSDRLFLKALVIMIVKHLHSPFELLSVLQQPTAEMLALRPMLTERGHYPTRRTWERRLRALPDKLPAQIGCLGRYLVALIQPWANSGRAAAVDSTLLRARGGVWHKKDRDAGVIPHSSIDTEAGWTNSGWHGWVYGWKLHLVTTVAQVWIPLAAQLTPANTDDGIEGVKLLKRVRLPQAVRYILGDSSYQSALMWFLCIFNGWLLVASNGKGKKRKGKPPASDDGVEVRRIFHKLRSLAIENFNEQFKGIFDGHAGVPTKGLTATRRFALGAIFVYQLALLYRFEHGVRGSALNVGLKAFLKAA
jgi:hypothetical protein